MVLLKKDGYDWSDIGHVKHASCFAKDFAFTCSLLPMASSAAHTRSFFSHASSQALSLSHLAPRAGGPYPTVCSLI